MILSDILTDAGKLWLGDDQQEQYTNAFLLDYFGVAYRETLRKLNNVQAAIAIRQTSFRLAANIDDYVLMNGLDGVGDNIISVWERAETSVAQIASVAIVNSLPTFTTLAPHLMAIGDEVFISGVNAVGGLNTGGLIRAIPAADQMTVGIPFTTAAVVGISGAAYISRSTYPWNKFDDVGGTLNRTKHLWSFIITENRIKFNPSDQNRMVLIRHQLQNNTQTFLATDNWPVETYRDYLAITLAMIASETKASEGVYATLDRKRDSILKEIQNNIVKAAQRRATSRPSHWSTRTRERNRNW